MPDYQSKPKRRFRHLPSLAVLVVLVMPVGDGGLRAQGKVAVLRAKVHRVSVLPGGGDGSGYTKVSGAMIRPGGGVLVGDAAESKIDAFDSRGRLEWSSGQRGSGPGDFLLPTLIVNDLNDSVIVFDAALRRVTVLNSLGRYIRSIALTQHGAAAIQGEWIMVDGILSSGHLIVREVKMPLSSTDGVRRATAKVRAVPLGQGSTVDLGGIDAETIVASTVRGRQAVTTYPFLPGTILRASGSHVVRFDGWTGNIAQRSLVGGAWSSIATLGGPEALLSRVQYESWVDEYVSDIPVVSARQATKDYFLASYSPWQLTKLADAVVGRTGELWIRLDPAQPASAEIRWLGLTLRNKLRREILLPPGSTLLDARGNSLLLATKSPETGLHIVELWVIE